jgi:hypothetical protein
MYKKDNYLRAVKSTSDQRRLYIPPFDSAFKAEDIQSTYQYLRVPTLGNRAYRTLRYLGRYCILVTRQA